MRRDKAPAAWGISPTNVELRRGDVAGNPKGLQTLQLAARESCRAICKRFGTHGLQTLQLAARKRCRAIA